MNEDKFDLGRHTTELLSPLRCPARPRLVLEIDIRPCGSPTEAYVLIKKDAKIHTWCKRLGADLVVRG